MSKNKVMKVVIFIAVILIPVIYSFFYLKSYWDPYGNLEDLKVAVVNLDSGENGENQGDELVKSLIDSKTININEVDETVAQDGLINGTYYAKIVIPGDFTKQLNNVKNVDREKTIIIFSPNKKSNYLAYQIINNVVTKTELSLQSKIAAKVVATLKENLEEVPNNMDKINDGVEQILEGSVSLSDGITTLNEGTNDLKINYTTFDEGLDSAYNGVQTLNSGMDSIKTGSTTLVEGTTSLDDAINQIKQGMSNIDSSATQGISSLAQKMPDLLNGGNNLNTSLQLYVNGVNSLKDNFDLILGQIKQMGDSNQELLNDDNFKMLYYASLQMLSNENYQNIKASSNQLVTGANNLSAGINLLNTNFTQISKLAQGINQLNDAVEKLSIGSNSIKNGTNTLDLGISQIKNGTQNLNDGIYTLSTNSKKVLNGIDNLNSGAVELKNGSYKLKDGLITLNQSITDGINDSKQELQKLENLDTYIEDPVEIIEQSYSEVEKYGVSFTPLFVSIGLWVGALMAYVVLYYDLDKRFKLLGKYSNNRYGQIFTYFLVAIIQGIITALLLKLGLGFEVQNVFVYYISCILIAICFMSIIQFLIMNFGDIGKFLALIILVLQLAASGGTFPVETINKGFRVFTNFLPMTYSIKLLKESVIMSDANFILKNICILLIYMIISLLITLIVVKLKQKYIKDKDVVEEVEVK